MLKNKYLLLQQTIENSFEYQLIPEYKFDEIIQNQSKKRQWRFDFAILEHKIAIEIEGGIYGFYTQAGHRLSGGHNSIDGIKKDIEKYNKATSLGWSVFRILASDAKNNIKKIHELTQLIENKIKNG